MTIAIRPAVDHEDINAFLDIEQRAMAHLSAWLPPPRRWTTSLFDPKRNPLFERGEVIRYVADRDGEIVGRIAAWVDERAPGLGFFGFFDVLPDVEAGRALVWAAADWCHARECTAVRGPFDFWAICSAGVPVSGFELPNTFALHHGAEHYAECLRAGGFESVEEIYTWQFGQYPVPPPALGIARATLTNPAIRFVPFDADSDEHWSIVHELYEICYVDHEWFFPMEQEELQLIAGDWVAPKVSFLAFVRGTPAAMSVGLCNIVESSVRIGTMIPPEPIQRILRVGHRPKTFRQWLYAVAPPFRGRALGHLSTAMYVHLRERADEAGYTHGEAGWTQADDERRTAALSAVGARRDKTYHVFERRWSGE